MALYDDFPSLPSGNTHKSLTGWHIRIRLSNYDGKRSKAVIRHSFADIAEDRKFSMSDSEETLLDELIQDLKFVFTDEFPETFDLPVWEWNEIPRTLDHSRENILFFGHCESVYRGSGMRWSRRRKVFADRAVGSDAIMVELRNLAAKKVGRSPPRSVLGCYADRFLNLQKKKGISWEASVTDAVKISYLADLMSSISEGDHYEVVDLHLSSSTGQQQPQPHSKMSSNASKLLQSSNPRASESEDDSILSSGCINGMDTTNINKMKILQQAPQPPEIFIYLPNYHATSRISINGLLATICVLTTFVAALGFSSSTFKDAYSTSKDAIMGRIIIAMNTLVFIVSLVMDMCLLQKSTYKWELQITLFALFGAYICLMKVMIPQAAFPLFLLSVPFLFFAAF